MTAEKINDSTHGHLTGAQMQQELARQRLLTLSTQLVETYERLLVDQPIATELFTPEPLRAAIESLRAELAK